MSHLQPNFVLRRFYETAPTGAARTAGVPNRRTTAGITKRFLCGDCEQRFATRETRWAETVDRPHASRRLGDFICEEAHRYFAASLAWRTIAFEHGEAEGFTAEDDAFIARAESALRSYLLGDAHPDDIMLWHHLVIAPDGFEGAPPGMNVYLRGALDPTMNGNGLGLYCINVLGGYLVVTVLSVDPDYLITWTLGTELRPRNRVRCTPHAFPQDPNFRSILAWRAGASVDSNKLITPRQHEVIRKRVEAIPRDELRYNPHVIAHAADVVNEKIRRQQQD